MSEKWIETEIDHRVSKTASDIFWKLANDMFHPLYVAKGDRGRKIPQMAQIRNKLNKKKIPRVGMDVGFKSKETGDITVIEDVTVIPTTRFPPNQYHRLFEIASVPVRKTIHENVYFINFKTSQLMYD